MLKTFLINTRCNVVNFVLLRTIVICHIIIFIIMKIIQNNRHTHSRISLLLHLYFNDECDDYYEDARLTLPEVNIVGLFWLRVSLGIHWPVTTPVLKTVVIKRFFFVVVIFFFYIVNSERKRRKGVLLIEIVAMCYFFHAKNRNQSLEVFYVVEWTSK